MILLFGQRASPFTFIAAQHTRPQPRRMNGAR